MVMLFPQHLHRSALPCLVSDWRLIILCTITNGSLLINICSSPNHEMLSLILLILKSPLTQKGRVSPKDYHSKKWTMVTILSRTCWLHLWGRIGKFSIIHQQIFVCLFVWWWLSHAQSEWCNMGHLKKICSELCEMLRSLIEFILKRRRGKCGWC